MIGISDKQGEMLAFIEKFVTENGYPPTREEIRTGLNISTKSLVNYHLEALENAALLTRVPNTPRGLRLAEENGGPSSPSAQASNNLSGDFAALDHDEVIELTYNMVTNTSNLYALKVEGEAMIDAQVNNGDIVILQRQTHAQNGEMVAVRLLEFGETTLKRYYRENGHVRLQPADINLEPVIASPEAVEVQGKVVAVIRHVD